MKDLGAKISSQNYIKIMFLLNSSEITSVKTENDDAEKDEKTTNN